MDNEKPISSDLVIVIDRITAAIYDLAIVNQRFAVSRVKEKADISPLGLRDLRLCFNNYSHLRGGPGTGQRCRYVSPKDRKGSTNRCCRRLK